MAASDGGSVDYGQGGGVSREEQVGTAPPEAVRLAANVESVLTRLLRGSYRVAADDLAQLVSDAARGGGFAGATLLLVDMEQRVLTPLQPTPEGLEPQEIDTTVAGRVFQREVPIPVAGPDDGSTRLWVPLIDGAERLGVIAFDLPTISDELVARCEDLAHLVAELVVSKTQYGDALVVARRFEEMTLAAELRWSMLPPLTFTAERVGISCVLEPAYEVAGDAFDYALNEGVLHLAIIDAMGHGLEASRMANLAIGSYRAARRRRLDLPATFRLMDESMSSEFGDEKFVTAQLATLDSRDGTLQWLNAGHPHPLLLRHGRSSELASTPALPLGLGDTPSVPLEVSLQPDDSVLFFTDGVVEAPSPGGEPFGQERLVDLVRRALADQQTLAETVRRLVRSVRAHREGPLPDDATILFVKWFPQ